MVGVLLHATLFVFGARSFGSEKWKEWRKMDSIDDEIVRKILRAIGKQVSYKYPGNEGQRNGVLRDRVVDRANPGEPGVPYWYVIDLIEFPEEGEQEWIRISYYRKPSENLVYGGQTATTGPVKTWKRLLVKAAKEKPWFRKLLDEVMNELR